MELRFTVKIKIQKAVGEVFEAVCEPTKLSGYFTNGGAKGRLESGTTVEWAFNDGPGQEARFPVHVGEVIPNELITFQWDGLNNKLNTVEFRFKGEGPETVVEITEFGWETNDEGLKSSYSNCMGWSQMLSALKAYLEHGIDLRKGAYTGLY